MLIGLETSCFPPLIELGSKHWRRLWLPLGWTWRPLTVHHASRFSFRAYVPASHLRCVCIFIKKTVPIAGGNSHGTGQQPKRPSYISHQTRFPRRKSKKDNGTAPCGTIPIVLAVNLIHPFSVVKFYFEWSNRLLNLA